MIKAIDDCLENLKNAIYENIEASRMECEAKIRKEKAHYNLLQVKEELRNIELDEKNYENMSGLQ